VLCCGVLCCGVLCCGVLWCAITQWVAYNAAAILIFAVNSYVYRVY
jgi:hypothetical protein